MKWFKHQSDSYTDLKMRTLLDEFGADGYATFFILCELVAQQGHKYKLISGTFWKILAPKILQLEQKRFENIIQKMANLKLIDSKALSIGTLYVPKMKKYCADYDNKKVRTLSGHCPDIVRTLSGAVSEKVPLEEKRKEEKRIYINSKAIKETKRNDIKTILLFAHKKGIEEFVEDQFQSFIKRNLRASQFLKGYEQAKIEQTMDWLNKNAEFKWTLETVSKFIDEDLKKLSENEMIKKGYYKCNYGYWHPKGEKCGHVNF